jgi:hypothetical protein
MSNDKLIDNAPDTYCHKLARIDELGPHRRLVFTIPDLHGDNYEAVTVKLIVPAEALMQIAYMAAGADRESVSPELIAHQTGRAN